MYSERFRKIHIYSYFGRSNAFDSDLQYYKSNELGDGLLLLVPGSAMADSAAFEKGRRGRGYRESFRLLHR